MTHINHSDEFVITSYSIHYTKLYELADTGWDQVMKAKNEGLPTYFGNPVSEHADRHIQLVGVRGVLALFPHEAANVAVAIV